MIKRILAIAINTFRESVRSKILYSIVFFAILVIGMASAFGAVTIGDQAKVLKDFGLFGITFFVVAFSVISGSSFLYNELSRKTIFNILSKRVQRSEFVLGKFSGMLLTVALMIAAMGAGLAGYMWLFEGKIDTLLFYAYAGIFFQLLIVAALVIFFSSIVITPMLSGIFAFGVFLAGRSSEYLTDLLKHQIDNELIVSIINGLYYVLPHFDKMDVSNQVVYGKNPGVEFILAGCWYSSLYAAVLLIFACLFFNKKEFN